MHEHWLRIDEDLDVDFNRSKVLHTRTCQVEQVTVFDQLIVIARYHQEDVVLLRVNAGELLESTPRDPLSPQS